MKDSGIEWIGQIPEEWKVRKLKHFYKFSTGFTPTTKNELYYDSDRHNWVTISDLGTNKYLCSSENGISKLYEDEFKPSIVRAGSLLYSFKLSVGQVAITKNDLYTNEAIAAFEDDEKAPIDFLYYSAQVCIIKNANDNIYGAKLLNQELINNAFIVFPPITEQNLIATYLDRKCSEIDSIVRETEQTIEEYKKLKQSLITEMVTGKKRVAADGLSLSNEPRKMKDSGVEWIGEVPEEWNLCPFRHLLKERSEKNNPIKSEERLSLSIELGVTLYSEKTTNLDRFKDDFTQYKLAHEGDLVMNSMNMIVGASGVSKYFGCVSPVYYTYYDELEDHVTTKFCEYIFRCKTMLRVLYSLGKGIYAIERGDDKVNTCRLKVSKEDLKSIMIPCPSENEQRIIVKYLSTKCTEIDNLIADKQTLLQELDTYKKSLIYECVTGKREVN